jgi:hypothetical protein
MADAPRRFPAPWRAEKIAGGYVVRDANGQALAYLYSRENEAEARQAKMLTADEARRRSGRNPAVTIRALYDAARFLLYAMLLVAGYCDLAAARHRVLAAIHPGRLCAELSDAHVPTTRPDKRAIQSVLASFMFLSR